MTIHDSWQDREKARKGQDKLALEILEAMAEAQRVDYAILCARMQVGMQEMVKRLNQEMLKP